MTTISSLIVSESLPSKETNDDIDTPTTPKPTRFSDVGSGGPQPPLPSTIHTNDLMQEIKTDAAKTPTMSTHGNRTSIAQSEEYDGAKEIEDPEAMEVDSVDQDDEHSDNDTEQGETDASSKKRKGQRFFCTGYPPCNLSFTRSEHLARHIRKHTGERPFQCHCNRRFSRLDNLRQHAQTVHVNEEIPTDSLAATGTRFQRQVRTDRVRPPGRSRTGTMSSAGGHSRGHSRNLSASSVGSTTSNFSTATETKRRPPPLLMATDAPRHDPNSETPTTPPAQYRNFGNNSPTGLSTPTSATYSATPGSPGYPLAIDSPGSSHARSGNYLSSKPPSRRLSVPSGPYPFQSQFGNPYSTPFMSQMATPPSNASTNSSAFPSPTSSTFSYSQGYSGTPGEDWRRRTWHPSSYTGANFNYGRPATSGLTYSQTPDAPQSSYAPHIAVAAAQAPRLPGIESFDHVQHRPSTPPRRQLSPMHVDSIRTNPFTPPVFGHDRHRASHISWDGSRSSIYPDLDDKPALRPFEMRPPQNQIMNTQRQQHVAQEALQLHSSNDRIKRQAWYNGPIPGARTSPEDSSSSEGVPTPGTSAVDVHPIIMHSNGFIEPPHGGMHSDGPQNVSYSMLLEVFCPTNAQSSLAYHLQPL